MAFDNNWSWQRYKKHETLIAVEDFLCPAYFLAKWQPVREKLVMQGVFSIEIPKEFTKKVRRIVEALDHELEEARFSFCARLKRFVFEKTIPGNLRGIVMLNRLESTFFDALSTGERLCEAITILIEKGKSESEAIFMAITPLVGHA
jgi:hypothetical protein